MTVLDTFHPKGSWIVKQKFFREQDMRVDFFCPRWGAENVNWPVFTKRIHADGYAGVEVFPLDRPSKNRDMLTSISDLGLEYILLQSVVHETRNFKHYLEALERNLYALLSYQNTVAKPLFIVSQTGREYYTMDQMATCFSLCDRIAEESGIPIIQETHRNKWSYAAHVVHSYLKCLPNLQLALDISHWVCVSESYLEDQSDAVDLAIQHSRHIHARVGYIEGPQVTDPRTPENHEALLHHLNWWDQWIGHLQKIGHDRATITPEFGPHPYMAYLPNTVQPIAHQYDINLWMKQTLQNRYTSFTFKS